MDFDDEDVIGPYKVISELLATPSEEEKKKRGSGGPFPRKRANVGRDHEETAKRLHNMYFSNNSTFHSETFCRCFRLAHDIFDKVF